MPYSKEQSLVNQNPEVDEVALKEVENYIEKVERQTEKSAADNNGLQNNVGVRPSVNDTQTPILVGVADKKLEPIVLPITQKMLEVGLKDNPTSGFKWLAEWCLMMIRKYPNRVFYSSSNTHE